MNSQQEVKAIYEKRYQQSILADVTFLHKKLQQLFDEIESYRRKEFFDDFNSLEKIEAKTKYFVEQIENCIIVCSQTHARVVMKQSPII